MAGIVKTVFKVGLVVVVIGGAATLIAGPQRMGALMHQVKATTCSVIDDNIEDPVALRRQLQKLEKEYPARIKQVQGDLAELNEQMRQLDNERAVAEKVVALAKIDRAGYEDALARHEAAALDAPRTAAYSTGRPTPAVSRLRAGLNHVYQTEMTYAAQAEDATRDLGYLEQQAARLEGLLAQLQTERAQFQAQLLQLDRQVDAVARNERLIEIMEKRQATIERLSRHDVASLDQLEGRLSEIRARQEAQLQVLAEAQNQSSYEDRARWELQLEQSTQSLPEATHGNASHILEVTPAF